jgi:hypothetical protein
MSNQSAESDQIKDQEPIQNKKLDKGKKISNLSFTSVVSTILSPATMLIVPTAQRINYWINMKARNDYETYRYNHEFMAPLILSPLSSFGSCAYQPVLHFDNVDEKEFSNDLQNNTQVVIGNHVGYSDFFLALQIAIHYGIESHFVAYFMKAINKWPIIGPTLWANIPLARDGSDRNLCQI